MEDFQRSAVIAHIERHRAEMEIQQDEVHRLKTGDISGIVFVRVYDSSCRVSPEDDLTREIVSREAYISELKELIDELETILVKQT